MVSASEDQLVMKYLHADGQEGFPGNLQIEMTYSLTPENEFRIDYSATTDKPTVVNLSHHPFFNLKGEGNGTILDHVMTINASHTTPVDSVLIPTGEIADVISAIGNHDEGTAMPVNPVAAALILADKTDVRRSRVRNRDFSTFDIHDRVNYAVESAETTINEEHTAIVLRIVIDTEISAVMDYFEIFLGRMVLCRKAAEKLGLRFKLVINGQELL